jgi:hypothetical protein
MPVNNKLIILITGLILSSSMAVAQEADAPAAPAAPAAAAAPAKTANIKKGKVSVTFDDELVKGSAVSPEGDVITSRLENRFKRFIKVRKDFIQDVENTKDEFGHK